MQFIAETFSINYCSQSCYSKELVSFPKTQRTGENEWNFLFGCYPTSVVSQWKQKFTWDCGIACCCMILSYYGLHVRPSELYTLCGTNSVWTIDLVHLLKKYGISLKYYTINWGARLEYKRQPFYQANFQEDHLRVKRLFEQARAENIQIVKQSVKLKVLKEILGHVFSEDCFLESPRTHHKPPLILLLVDKRYLRCSICKHSFFYRWKRLCWSGFLGHYILLWGYNSQGDTFWYADPASSQDFCCTSSEELERCRKSFGTDEDLIILNGLQETLSE
eukprot:jgi/Galph1/578/GphlegSOOS_G5366.1